MQSKSTELQDQINELDVAIQEGATDAQLNLWEMRRKELNEQLQTALAEEAQEQERLQVQEAEVESIKLPYDFNEILSEGDFRVTTANDMIIEVVKDTKRQANIEKNQAIDELKAAYTEKSIERESALQAKIDSQQSIIENGAHTIEQLKGKINEVMANQQQSNLERDDAFAKRDAAFRQLQEAQEEIITLKIKLENAPQAKQTFDISPSDKLAKMVKESLEEKVNRGLARWDIPVIEPLNNVLEEEVSTTEVTFQETDQAETTDTEGNNGVEGNEAIPQGLGEGTEESQVITLESLKNEVDAIKTYLGLVA